jgi:antitoxin HicB
MSERIGSSFESFLNETGSKEDIYAAATKRVLAWQIEQAMEAQNMSKTQMAKKMKTSRSQLDRLLDPTNMAVQIDTIQKAAAAVGRKLVIELREPAPV